MWFFLSIILLAAICIALFFLIPYSPTSAAYHRLANEKIRAEPSSINVFTEADINRLPLPVQRYFHYCWYLDTPKMSYMKAFFYNVDFVMSESKKIKINYQQLNLASRPERFALISSSLSGIPFEGIDSFDNGEGSMKGTLAKVIPLFNQRGENMDRACLVTWLAECLLVPNAALQEFVTWEAMDNTHTKATIFWHDISASGVFTFADSGELLSFRTSDRGAVDLNGNQTAADWAAYFCEYDAVNGILQARIMRAVWDLQSADLI